MLLIRDVNLRVKNSGNFDIITGLSKVFGLGRTKGLYLIASLGINRLARFWYISQYNLVLMILLHIEGYFGELDLKRIVSQNVKDVIDKQIYKSLRHIYFLPVRGQRTRSNARTRKNYLRLILKSKKKKK